MLIPKPTHDPSWGQYRSLSEATNNMALHDMPSVFDSSEPIPLSSRFAKLKRNMIACREKDVAESFYRLIRALRKEADDIAARGSNVIPTIDYFDIHDSAKASAFRKALRRRGVAVIKRVVPTTVAQAWKDETLDYIADNPQTKGHPSHDPQLFDLYWSPSQVRARADSRLLDAQRFAMRTWHSSDDHALVSSEYPVVYADRLRVRTPDEMSPTGGAHIDNGSVERWEPDGYGASGTYSSVFSGRWEDYDPWDSSPRLHITTDLYNRSGSCSMFRMFQGILSLSSVPAGSGALTVCPMLQLSTTYLLLRPFFTPRHKNPAAKMMDNYQMGMSMGMGTSSDRRRAEMDFLHPTNWNLNVSQTSVLHGAVPGYVQQLSSALHPHLQMHRTMVSAPDLEPGDYVIWHPDVVHAVDTAYFPGHSPLSPSRNPYPPSNFTLTPPSSNPFAPLPSPYSFSSSSSRSGSIRSRSDSFSFYSPLSSSSTSSPSSSSPPYRRPHLHSHHSSSSSASSSPSDATLLYIPSCPLTQTNALYLARQRRAFLLGLPAPDFAEIGNSAGERDHTGRADVQDVADAGGDDALRSMGLSPFEVRRGDSAYSSSNSSTGRRERERGGGGGGWDKDVELLRLANGILFPDRFDAVLRKGGGRR
ncbi:DUF1479-domain-containing protein [Xylaria bambusicola]|uniref:DUF1479-domain-containing protein n=1 Tax=Xylaria bambusicola TaxID=326684 RepID=UPI0020086BEE|nr:DUF1479-domain-containing protein [Xylaria bambusicola]KAI0517192.1 DUF1479-domain-containing protein [Xylaria bambusicola]